MDNETIGSRLLDLKQRSGLSLGAIAKRAGYSGPSSIQKYFQPDYNPVALPSHVGEKLTKAFKGQGTPEITRDDLATLVWATKDRTPDTLGPTLYIPGEDTTQPSSLGMPMYSSAIGEGWTFCDDAGGEVAPEITLVKSTEPMAYISRNQFPSELSHCFVLFISGNSMHPRHKAGEPVVVDPRRPPSIGDDVLVELKPNADSDLKPFLVKTLRHRSVAGAELEQYSPAARFLVPALKIANIYRVIPWRETFKL